MALGCAPATVSLPTDSAAPDTAPPDAVTQDVAPDTAPPDDAPADTPPADTPPTDTTPADVPTDTGTAADAPQDATADVPADTAPADTAPVDTAPADVPTDGGGTCRGTSDCAARGQVCDVSRGACVECLSGAQCAGAGQACVAGRCVAGAACTTSRTCAGLVCDTARGVCVECLTGTDCAAGQVCRSGACGAAARACRSSRDCSASEQVCETTRGVCVDCAADVDCPSGQFCGTDNFCYRQVCTPGATACVDARRVRTCDARGSAETTRACAETETCAMGRCQARVCAPGTRSCASSTTPRTCNEDGLGYTALAACPAGQTCNAGACTACDTDGDGDDDGLVDVDERALGSDPCNRDTDGDGVTDLVERLALTDMRSAASRPDAVVAELPYRTDGGGALNREVSYTHRALPVDVMLVVDSTGSLASSFTALREGVAETAAALVAGGGDVRVGAADFRDFAEGGSASSDYAFTVRQRPAADGALVRSALAGLHAEGGGDVQEALVPALYGLLEGVAFPGYRSPTRDATASDCAGDATAFGWACFRPGRLPVLVAYSDAAWHNAPGDAANFYRSVPMAPTYASLAAAVQRRNARYVGVEISATSGTEHARPSETLARDAGALDAAGSPMVFRGTASATSARVVAAVRALSGQGTGDVATRVLPNPAERRLPAGRTTADFVRAVNALRGTPDAPAGFERRDGTTFYRVAQGTTVVFNAVLRNDLVAPVEADQAFRASIAFTVNGAVLRRQDVWVLVPAAP